MTVSRPFAPFHRLLQTGHVLPIRESSRLAIPEPEDSERKTEVRMRDKQPDKTNPAVLENQRLLEHPGFLQLPFSSSEKSRHFNLIWAGDFDSHFVGDSPAQT